MAGLVLALTLLAYQAAPSIAVNRDAAEYNGAEGGGLVSRDPSWSIAQSPARMRLAQSRTSPDDDTAAARKKLREELDRVRGTSRERPNREGAAPQAAAKKKTAPASTAPSAAAPAKPKALPSIDPELDKVLGRLLIFRFKGTSPTDPGPRAIHGLLASGSIAGAMFDGENIQGKGQIRELTKFLAPPSSQSKPILAIQETGGQSEPFPQVKEFEPWPSEREVASKGDPQYAYSTYQTMGSSLSFLGFNLNFGPFIGAPPAPNSPLAFGSNPLETGVFAKTFILGHREANMAAVPIFDGGDLSVRALKTLLVSYPETPVAVKIQAGASTSPFLPLAGILRGPRFCFVALPSGGSEGEAANYLTSGCDILVVDGGGESPATVRERIAQVVSEGLKAGRLDLNALKASAQRLTALRFAHETEDERRLMKFAQTR